MAARVDRLVLIRHALTVQDPLVPSSEWRLADGQESACTNLAARLASVGVDRVVASREGKALATGRLIATQLNLPVEAADGLEEHHRAGAKYEPDPEKWRVTMRRFFDRPDDLVMGAETAVEARQRFAAALERELASRAGERLAVVSHATVMTLFLAEHYDLEPFEFWSSMRMPEAWVLELPGYGLLERYWS